MKLSTLQLISWASLSAFPVQAIVTRGNSNDPKFLANVEADAPFFVSLGERGDCAGTIVSDRHVLTAAHCVAGMNRPPTTILADGSTVKPWAVYTNPDCPFSVRADGPNGCDVAVLAFEGGVLDGSVALPVYPYSSEVGKTMTLYGYGLSGNAADLTRGCNRAQEDGKFRRAQNIVTDTSDGVIRYRMDDRNGLRLEGMAQDGDSGGAATITVNGVTYLVGANSGTMESNSCDYGSIDEYVRLSEHYDFITKVLDCGETSIAPSKVWKRLGDAQANCSENDDGDNENDDENENDNNSGDDNDDANNNGDDNDDEDEDDNNNDGDDDDEFPTMDPTNISSTSSSSDDDDGNDDENDDDNDDDAFPTMPPTLIASSSSSSHDNVFRRASRYLRRRNLSLEE